MTFIVTAIEANPSATAYCPDRKKENYCRSYQFPRLIINYLGVDH